MPRPSLFRTLLCGIASLISLQPLRVLAQNSTATSDNTSTSSTTASAVPTPNDASATCQCGFLDPTTSSIYTDSIIVYFNETNTSIPDNIFSIDSFEHRYEKGFQVYYREGAVAQNAYFESGSVWNLSPSWLNLNITGYDKQHLLAGAQIQTVRQDIQYGHFPRLHAQSAAVCWRQLPHHEARL